jgi:hypothetical protein
MPRCTPQREPGAGGGLQSIGRHLDVAIEGRRIVCKSRISPRNKGNIMGNQAPGSEQGKKDPNTQGTSSPSKDGNRTGQMEQDQGGRQNQQGGSQGQAQDKEKDRSKSGAQRPD